MVFFHRTRFDFYYLKKFNISWAVVVHALNTSTQEAEVGSQEDLCEIEASQVYRVSSRTAKTTERNPVSKQTNKQTNKRWREMGGWEKVEFFFNKKTTTKTKKHNIYLAF